MEVFEYEITKHLAADFSKLHFFCSDSGECDVENIPDSQIRRLTEMMNGQGKSGWEMVQISFGPDGLVIFWKRRISD